MLGLQETTSAGTPATKTYSCVACSATFQSLASLLVHQASHANAASHQSTLSTCVNCGSIFASADLLEKHHCMVSPTPASQEMRVCASGEAFDGITVLEDHRKLHKPDAQDVSNLDRTPKPLSSEMDGKTHSSPQPSGQLSPCFSSDYSSEEPLVKSASAFKADRSNKEPFEKTSSASEADHTNKELLVKDASSAFEADCSYEKTLVESASSASEADCSNEELLVKGASSASEADCSNEKTLVESSSSASEADHSNEERLVKGASSAFEADCSNEECLVKGAASEADCSNEECLVKGASSAFEADRSIEEPFVKSACSTSEADIKMIVSTTDLSLPVESSTTSEQDQSLLKPHESPSSHTMTEEQESVLEKESDTLDTSIMSDHSVQDCEQSADSCKESTAINRKSILKMLASAYMSHRQPAQLKPEQTKRTLPPRKVAPRAPMQVATAITMPKTLENQSKTNCTEKVLRPSSTTVNVKTGNMFSKKKKIISVIQTLYPVVVLETRQKLLGKDNVEGRHKCGLCRRVFQDIDSLIMHHAQHKKERVKFCLCCQQFVICGPENHICFGASSEKRQSLPVGGNISPKPNSPTTEQTQKLFSCSLCKRSYMWKRNLRRHKCPAKATLECFATVGSKSGDKQHGLKDDCNRILQDPNINQVPTQYINVAVGTEPIKTEEQVTQSSIVEKNDTALTIQSQSPGPEDQSHSPEPSESINFTPNESANTEQNAELPTSEVGMETEDKDKFEKQWTMPLDDAEIDVLIDVDQEDLDNDDILEDMVKEDHDEDEDEDEDVVIVEPPEDMKSLLPSDSFQVHVTDEGLKRFVCAGCQRSYSRRFTLIQHLKICVASKLKQQHRFVNTSSSVPGPVKKFPCPQCDKFFSRKDNMNMHRRKCHATNTTSLVCPRTVDSKTPPAQENLFVLSPSTETPTVRQESNRNSSNSWGIMSLPSVLPRRVTCECGSSFTCPRLLFEHLQLHAQESYICPHCGENLQSWMDFEAHQQLHGQTQGQQSEQRGPQLHPSSFSQVTQSHVLTQQQPHSFFQVTQSHVSTQQQPRLFSQVVQSHVPMGPQQSPDFQPSALKFNEPPSAPHPPQNLNHRQYPERVTCHRCKKTFARRRSLLRHLRLSCRGGDATGQRKPPVHIQSNTFKPTFKPIRCPVCVRWFSCVDGLKRHLVSHSRQPVLSCQLCGHNCSSFQELEDHKQNVHDINRTIVPAEEKREQVCTAAGPQSTPTDFQCHVCHRYYPKLQSLKDHVRKVHRLKPSEHINLNTADPNRSGQFQCQICMRTYPSIKSLKNHRRRVHHIVGGVFRVHHIVGGVFQPAKVTEQNRNLFQCQICGRSYPDIGSLRNHRRRVHRILGGLEHLKGIAQQSQHNEYKCQICQRNYPDLLSLKNHRRRVHHILGPVTETTTNDAVDAVAQKQSDSQTYL